MASDLKQLHLVKVIIINLFSKQHLWAICHATSIGLDVKTSDVLDGRLSLITIDSSFKKQHFSSLRQDRAGPSYQNQKVRKS